MEDSKEQIENTGVIEGRLRAIVEAAVDAIITINDRGIIESCNPATRKMFGYEGRELIGKNISVLMPQPYAREHDDYIGNYLRTGQKKIIGIGREVETKQKDGTIFPVHIAISEVSVDGKRLFTGIVRDISDRIKAEQDLTEDRAKLIHAEKMAALGEMAAGIAHELGTPIATVRGRMELLESQLNQKEIEKSHILKVAKTIRNEADRMTRIIRGILSFARDGSKDPFRKVSIKSLISDVLEYSTEKFRKHGIAVDIGEINEELTVQCRETEIAQVIVNLLSNACDAIHKLSDRWIRFDAVDKGDFIEVSVTDSGLGIPEETRKRIMDPFFTTKPAGTGTGLGLSVSHSILQVHRGSLRLDTESDNTRFIISLPKNQPTLTG